MRPVGWLNSIINAFHRLPLLDRFSARDEPGNGRFFHVFGIWTRIRDGDRIYAKMIKQKQPLINSQAISRFSIILESDDDQFDFWKYSLPNSREQKPLVQSSFDLGLLRQDPPYGTISSCRLMIDRPRSTLPERPGHGPAQRAVRSSSCV
jgi:hypothetical protein